MDTVVNDDWVESFGNTVESIVVSMKDGDGASKGEDEESLEVAINDREEEEEGIEGGILIDPSVSGTDAVVDGMTVDMDIFYCYTMQKK